MVGCDSGYRGTAPGPPWNYFSRGATRSEPVVANRGLMLI